MTASPLHPGGVLHHAAACTARMDPTWPAVIACPSPPAEHPFSPSSPSSLRPLRCRRRPNTCWRARSLWKGSSRGGRATTVASPRQSTWPEGAGCGPYPFFSWVGTAGAETGRAQPAVRRSTDGAGGCGAAISGGDPPGCDPLATKNVSGHGVFRRPRGPAIKYCA